MRLVISGMASAKGLTEAGRDAPSVFVYFGAQQQNFFKDHDSAHQLHEHLIKATRPRGILSYKLNLNHVFTRRSHPSCDTPKISKIFGSHSIHQRDGPGKCDGRPWSFGSWQKITSNGEAKQKITKQEYWTGRFGCAEGYIWKQAQGKSGYQTAKP
jgi:hypothetical protein